MEISVIHALPTPTTTPYRTPSSWSRRSIDMSPSTTPPPLIPDDKITKRRSHDGSNAALDESISPLDPRRFTPTLHANLVSEILSLRRDLESKTKDIDRLEQSLHTSQKQNDTLTSNLTASNRDNRSLKRQMQILEGGTLSAINDVSKERDAALDELSELRSRLEQSQRKAKSQIEDATRTQAQWDKDKDTWATEKRALETKIHVVEGRLKVVLNEVANAQLASAASEHSRQRSESWSSLSGSPTKRPVGGAQDRRQSATSTGSDHMGGRTSALSFTHGTTTTLADELALDDIDEGGSDEAAEEYGRVSPDALPEERGRPASSLSIKARKILGLPFDIEDMGHNARAQSTIDAQQNQDPVSRILPKRPTYVDSAVQYSRPSTPVEGGHMDQMGLHNIVKASTVMVSASCQTTEQLPSPPLTPKQHEAFLATIPESAWEKPETREISIQTDPISLPSQSSQHVHPETDTRDLRIPVIAIIPPSSRPATPQNTAVPPSAAGDGDQAQVSTKSTYTSTSMQTEEIRIDRRNMLSSGFLPETVLPSQVQATNAKGKGVSHPRRSTQPVSKSAMKTAIPPVPPIPTIIPPPEEDTSAVKGASSDKSKSFRSTTLVADFDDEIRELGDAFEEDDFDDDDVFNRPTAKFSLRGGKLVTQNRSLEDLSELAARDAGQALAMENLRQGEDALPPELRGAVDAISRNKSLKRTTTIRRGQSSTVRSNSNNMRRAAMITNGTAAHNHQHKQSQSSAAGSSESSGVAPPIPIPLRYSSARLGKSFSEGGRTSRGSSSNNASPTRQGRRVVKPALRKARSGPALSPAAAARRQRSKSPPLNSRISIVPDIPVFNMPNTSQVSNSSNLLNTPAEASAPRPSIATGPSRTGHHAKTNSDAQLIQQTSVVEAIAQTMVGEWMYKYVRKRKSFGKPEKDWDPNKSADELINNPGNAGIRHKRWVWVEPYERAIMWSSKQPMNDTALLGKNGRKLTIKSVLDVKDDNPLPKNSLTGPSFNRSILILTAQRALKFTATSQERHYIWLTALSFLSHSPLSMGDLAALPPPPEEYPNTNEQPMLTGSMPKRKIRDSIRLAKGAQRPPLPFQTIPSDDPPLPPDFLEQRPPTQDTFDSSNDAALPPVIKRFHTRKRSNTAPKAPPSAFRSTLAAFREAPSSGPTSSYSQSVGTTDRGSTDRGPHTPSWGNPSIPSTRRGSEASALGRPGPGSFYNFESNSSHNASMTMRMDAFIENKQSGKGGYRNLRLSQNTKPGEKKKDISYWGFDENGIPSLSPVETTTPGESSLRYSESTGRGSVERDYFRNF